jgi:hypothetical protein
MTEFRVTRHTTDPLPRGLVRPSVYIKGTWVAGITWPTRVPGFRMTDTYSLFPYDTLPEAFAAAQRMAENARWKVRA